MKRGINGAIAIYILTFLKVCSSYHKSFGNEFNWAAVKADGLESLLRNLCVSESNCQPQDASSRSAIWHESDPCCQPCVCTEFCATGNCCPGTTRHPVLQAECRNQERLFWKSSEGGVNATFYPYDHEFQYLYMVDYCTQPVEPHITQGCLEPQTISDHWIVAARNGSVLFRNENCALCNGLTDYVFWDIEMYVDSQVDISGNNMFLISDDGWLDIAQVLSVPPVHMINAMRAHICDYFYIERGVCYSELFWENKNPDIAKVLQRGCIDHEFGSRMYFTRYMMYANPSCVFCWSFSVPPGNDTSHLCSPTLPSMDYYEDHLNASFSVSVKVEGEKKDYMKIIQDVVKTADRDCAVDKVRESVTVSNTRYHVLMYNICYISSTKIVQIMPRDSNLLQFNNSVLLQKHVTGSEKRS